LAVLVAGAVAVAVGVPASAPAEQAQFCCGASLPDSDVMPDSSLNDFVRAQQQ
jgi:hypothetical protein